MTSITTLKVVFSFGKQFCPIASTMIQWLVNLPSVGEQEEIARILDEQFARIEVADSKVQEALD